MNKRNSLYGEENTPPDLIAIAKESYDTQDVQTLLTRMNEIQGNYSVNPEFFALRGSLHIKVNNIDEAFEDLGRAISLNPDNAAYYHIRGDQHFQLMNFLASKEDFEYIVNTENLNQRDYFLNDSHHFLLMIYCVLGNWDLASKELLKLPDDYVFYYRPISGMINKERLNNAIAKRNQNWWKDAT